MLISRSVVEAVIAHARAEAPHECCGLLIGTADAIERAHPARNRRASPTSYLVDPQDHFAAIRLARRTSRAVVGAYHSHPASPAVPSPADLREASDPELVYVIVSLAASLRPEMRAYRLGWAGFVEIALLVEEGQTDTPERQGPAAS